MNEVKGHVNNNSCSVINVMMCTIKHYKHYNCVFNEIWHKRKLTNNTGMNIKMKENKSNDI